MSKDFPFTKQFDANDCGAACLSMISKHYGRIYSLGVLRELSYIGKEGATLMGISDAAEYIGLHTLAAKLSFDRLIEDIPMPCIAHWQQNHFMVIYEVNDQFVRIGDPARTAVTKITKEEFLNGWISDYDNGEEVGVLLLLETTPAFYEREEDGNQKRQGQASYLRSYLSKHKKLIFQLVIGLIVGSIIQLIFPFLMESLINNGVTKRNFDFIYIIVFAHFALYLGLAFVEYVRGYILMFIGSRININLVSDFLAKLMRLPVKFFDTKITGDLMQRIYDNQRVEQFLASSPLIVLFSTVNFVIFGMVLLYYNRTIFAVFLAGTILYVLWVNFFLKKRKELDYKRFDQRAENQSSLIQLISGMQEIKLHNAEKQKRWAWERIQAKLYRSSMENLKVDQLQYSGASFINETKNILISGIAAMAVVNNQLSLGTMFAIQYIVGQLNAPVKQLIFLIRSAQDAKISLDRMDEIHLRDDEEDLKDKITIMPENGDLNFEDVSFQYGGPHSPEVLKDINFDIPEGKTTAIVGISGSGKTTLLKLLLNFYSPTRGAVKLGDINLNNIQNRVWRDKVGVVMQNGFIFSESIAKNIALGDEVIDKRKLLAATKIAHIHRDIESMPLGYNTKIGEEGLGLSQGQTQRILIARAVYKDPEYIFFDEATNALDANTERVIMENLDQFFDGRTVVIVAHRLSTVKKADNIIVLEKGRIVEEGTHRKLTNQKGIYYKLVKNQLELGN